MRGTAHLLLNNIVIKSSIYACFLNIIIKNGSLIRKIKYDLIYFTDMYFY